MKALVVSERLLADLGVMDGVKRQVSWMKAVLIFKNGLFSLLIVIQGRLRSRAFRFS